MLTVGDEELINKSINEFLKDNKSIDVADLKLKVWNYVKLLSDNNDFNEDNIKKILSDLSVLNQEFSIKHDWALNRIVDTDLCANVEHVVWYVLMILSISMKDHTFLKIVLEKEMVCVWKFVQEC